MNTIVFRSKDEIKEEIEGAAKAGKSIIFDFEQLRFAFGFRRIGGTEFNLISLISSKTEEQLSYLPSHVVRDNIEAWCRENNIKYSFDFYKYRYIFRAIL